jgi:hypothetical protein
MIKSKQTKMSQTPSNISITNNFGSGAGSTSSERSSSTESARHLGHYGVNPVGLWECRTYFGGALAQFFADGNAMISFTTQGGTNSGFDPMPEGEEDSQEEKDIKDDMREKGIDAIDEHAYQQTHGRWCQKSDGSVEVTGRFYNSPWTQTVGGYTDVNAISTQHINHGKWKIYFSDRNTIDEDRSTLNVELRNYVRYNPGIAGGLKGPFDSDYSKPDRKLPPANVSGRRVMMD